MTPYHRKRDLPRAPDSDLSRSNHNQPRSYEPYAPQFQVLHHDAHHNLLHPHHGGSEDDSLAYEDEFDLMTSTPMTFDLDEHLDYDHDLPSPPRLGLRGEEIGIIVGIMLLWVAAIALFFNRWGKIRSLEPYQPKFCEEHRPSCPISEASMPPTLFPRSFSKLNLLTEENPHYAKFRVTGGGAVVGGLAMRSFGIPTGVLTSNTNQQAAQPARASSSSRPMRPRQNSLFSPYAVGLSSQTYRSAMARRTKSAIDLPSLILSEQFFESVRRNSKLTHV